MSHSVAKQAITIELLEQIRADEKLQILIEDLWSYGGDGMFNWFQSPPATPSGYVRNPVVVEYKQDYRADYPDSESERNYRHFPFEPEHELESYCTRLEQILGPVKLGDPMIAQRKVYLRSRIDEQIHSCLTAYLTKRPKASFPDLADDFASNVIWGGERLNSDYELMYLMPDQVGAIAQVLHTINIKELLSYFDTSQYNLADWLEDGEAAAHDLKKCFVEAAEKGQIVMTTVI